MSYIICRNGKICIPTKEQAIKVAENQSKVFGMPMYVYFCKWCNDFHLTKTKPNKSSSRRERQQRAERKK